MFPKTNCNYIYTVILIHNSIGINGLLRLTSNKNSLNTETLPHRRTSKLFDDAKLIENFKFFDFSPIHNFLFAVSWDHENNVRDVIRLTRVEPTSNETNLVDIINAILDGNENNNYENKNFNRNETVFKHIGSYVNSLQNWTASLTFDDDDFTDKTLGHLLDNNVEYNNTSFNYNDSETLSNDEFWQPSGRRIFHGDRTKIKYFPFMASVQIFQSFQCGGSIIKSDLIITAASCLQLAWNNRLYRENPAFLSVRVGSTFYQGGGETIPVVEVYFHPEYNPNNLYNNLCLLRLSRRIRFSKRNKRVKKIDIDRTPMKLPTTTDGITIVGWGAKGTSNILEDPWRNRLSFAVLDFYPLRECRDIYSSEYVTNKHFCAGFFSTGGGACNRDVGGPGVVNGILAGVVSFGSPVCGTTDAPTVFTKLGYYAEWIDEIMEQDVPYTYKKTTLKSSRIIPYIAASTPLTKTTFIIPPIGGVMKPLSISEIDTLRILKDENLFNEFLETVIDRNENISNLDTKDYVRGGANKLSSQSIPVTDNYAEPVNQMNSEDSREIVTEVNNKFTGIDKNLNVVAAHELENDIVKLMKSIDVNEAVESIESSGTDEELKNKNVAKMSKGDDLQEANTAVNKMNNSILTLLYLSDSEKKTEQLEDAYNVHDGLTIPAKPFKDMTFRNDKTDILEFMSKNDFYDLISETLNETQVKDDK